MDTIRIDALVMAFLIQLVGVVDHWLVMRKAGRVKGSLWAYLFGDYPGHSFATFFMLMGSAWLMALSGGADFLGWDTLYQLISNGLIDTHIASSITGAAVAAYGIGYAFDSKINKAAESEKVEEDAYNT